MPQPPQIVDSHCHLDFPDFADELPEIVARAQTAGVGRMLTICTSLPSEPDVRAIAERFPAVFYAVATHPMSVEKEQMASLDALLKIARHPKMVGIGETGLDYHYSADSAPLQRQSLLIHIEAARQTGLPLIIHARDADDDMARILRDEHTAGSFTCVMHCFSSSAALAEAAINLGFYLSMSGIATFKNSQQVRDIFATCPLDRVLVETDAPYLAPPPHRGRRKSRPIPR